MYKKLLALIVVVLLVSALLPFGSGAAPAAAQSGYYWHRENVHGMSCSDTGFAFQTDEPYSRPATGWQGRYTVQLSGGFSYDSGLFTPTSMNSAEVGTIINDNWLESYAAQTLPYTITHTVYFYVDGEEVSTSTIVLQCSAPEGYLLELISVVNSGGDAPAGAAGCDVLMAIPSTAVVGAFVKDAPLYYMPGNMTNPLATITAGNTAWVLGKDASGGYYKILWVCQYLWVPADTLGPNNDAVWHGAALPTGVVE